MKTPKVKWAGLAILSFATLSVFGVQASFHASTTSLKPASGTKQEILKMLSSYRKWDRINKQPIVFLSPGLGFSV